jgi:hypothetical protein
VISPGSTGRYNASTLLDRVLARRLGGLGELRGQRRPRLGGPGSPASFGGNRAPVLSLVPPRPQVDRDVAGRHPCAFWAATC